MKHDSRITLGEPLDDGRNEGRGENGAACDPHFPRRRVGEKLDVFDALAQVIEYGHPAIEQRATVRGRLDALAVAVEQAHAERILQLRDRSRNVGLGCIEALRRLPHGAGLHHGHEDVQVLQLHPASDAIAQLHVGPHFGFEMTSSDNSNYALMTASTISETKARRPSRPASLAAHAAGSSVAIPCEAIMPKIVRAWDERT